MLCRKQNNSNWVESHFSSCQNAAGLSEFCAKTEKKFFYCKSLQSHLANEERAVPNVRTSIHLNSFGSYTVFQFETWLVFYVFNWIFRLEWSWEMKIFFVFWYVITNYLLIYKIKHTRALCTTLRKIELYCSSFFPFPSVGQSENWKKGRPEHTWGLLCSYFFIWYGVHQIKFLFLRYFLIINLKGS